MPSSACTTSRPRRSTPSSGECSCFPRARLFGSTHARPCLLRQHLISRPKRPYPQACFFANLKTIKYCCPPSIGSGPTARRRRTCASPPTMMRWTWRTRSASSERQPLRAGRPSSHPRGRAPPPRRERPRAQSCRCTCTILQRRERQQQLLVMTRACGIRFSSPTN